MMISDINMQASWWVALFMRRIGWQQNIDTNKGIIEHCNIQTILQRPRIFLGNSWKPPQRSFLFIQANIIFLMEMPIWKAHTFHYRGGKTIFQVPWYSLIWFIFHLFCLQHCTLIYYVCSIIYCLQHVTWFIMSSAVSSAYVFCI